MQYHLFNLLHLRMIILLYFCKILWKKDIGVLVLWRRIFKLYMFLFYYIWSHCDLRISQSHILKIIAQNPNWVKDRYYEFSRLLIHGAILA